MATASLAARREAQAQPPVWPSAPACSCKAMARSPSHLVREIPRPSATTLPIRPARAAPVPMRPVARPAQSVSAVEAIPVPAHAGVEWHWWQGPTDCSGPIVDLGSAGNLLARLDSVKVVRCDEVQWKFLGLSLAGYNVLISLLMAALAVRGIVKAARD